MRSQNSTTVTASGQTSRRQRILVPILVAALLMVGVYSSAQAIYVRAICYHPGMFSDTGQWGGDAGEGTGGQKLVARLYHGNTYVAGYQDTSVPLYIKRDIHQPTGSDWVRATYTWGYGAYSATDTCNWA